MANYDSQLTGAQIESALEAVHGLIVPTNNGKIICVDNGALVAKSAVEIQGGTIDTLTITENGTYNHAALGGYSPIIVNVPSLITAKAIIKVEYDIGYTCTCTDGTTTYTSDTSGTWLFCLPNAGTWTLTSNGNTASKTMTEYGYETANLKSFNGVRVGGKIFYIDSNASGATYTFYDQNKNVISSVDVGDEPYYYEVNGTPSSDKYYVFYNSKYTSKKWATVTELINASGTAIGTGKTNTNLAMDKYADIEETIWNQLKSNNTNNVGGVNDWYCPSEDESETLYQSGLASWYTSSAWVFSSSESTQWHAFIHVNGSWTTMAKTLPKDCFFIRSF